MGEALMVSTCSRVERWPLSVQFFANSNKKRRHSFSLNAPADEIGNRGRSVRPKKAMDGDLLHGAQLGPKSDNQIEHARNCCMWDQMFGQVVAGEPRELQLLVELTTWGQIVVLDTDPIRH